MFIEINNMNITNLDLEEGHKIKKEDVAYEIALNNPFGDIAVPISSIIKTLKFESNFIETLYPSFYSEKKRLTNVFTGEQYHILPNVLVPDNRVLSLLLSVIVNPYSGILEDINNKIIYEPCCGSGIISRLISQYKPSKIYCSDIDDNSIKTTRQLLGSFDNKSIKRFDGIDTSKLYNTVFINPPWYSSNKNAGSKNRYRCFVDEKFEFLKNCLEDIYKCTSEDATIYLILGKENPFEYYNPHTDVKFDSSDFGWIEKQTWKNRRTMLNIIKLKKIGY